MRGRVSLKVGEQTATATMGDDGAWTFAGPQLGQDRLRMAAATVKPYGGPWDGQPGARQVAELAEAVGGEAEVPDRSDEEPGTIY